MLPCCATTENTCRSRSRSRRPIWRSQSIFLLIGELLPPISQIGNSPNVKTSVVSESSPHHNNSSLDATMQMRKTLLASSVALAFALGHIGGVAAPTYPTRPLTMVVTFAAGGGDDVLARI